MRRVFALAAVIWLPGCVGIPRLNLDAVAVSEVVERIKCELAVSLPDVRGEYDPAKPYQWIRYWTAKVDLDLQTTETGSVTPSGTYLDPAASLTLGIGGNLKAEAYRSDSISFTLSVDELMGLAAAQKCDSPRGLGLLGHLGLKEWVTSALGPVESRALTIGFHRVPGKTAQLLAPVERTTPTPRKSEREAGDKAALGDDAALKEALDSVEYRIKLAESYSETARIAATQAQKVALKQHISETFRYAKAASDKAYGAEIEVEAAKVLIWQARIKFHKYLGDHVQDREPASPSGTVTAKGRLKGLSGRLKDVTEQASAARSAAGAAWELLPRDAPLDSIAHTARFTVNASVNATPNWTLVRFRGPGLANPFASLQRVRVHELTIVLGSPAEIGGKEISKEQERQLLNAKINSRGFVLLQP